MSSLTIVIPALNEEQSIAGTIERTLAAKDSILKSKRLREVHIVVVSDGSTDRTTEIASKYLDHITLVSYDVNKGYGAAIKLGWTQQDSNYLGFLDADGTCDPMFFIDLLELMRISEADIVIGSRLHASSEMPLIRRMGNTFYARLLNLWTGSNIKDSASGMRILKRSVLPKIFPLPDGLHFTPAMSAKALFNNQVTIAEIPMPYSEREGESKLHVITDGISFLQVILKNAVQYYPRRLFNLFGSIFILVAFLFCLEPTWLFLSGHLIPHDAFIYRYIGIYSFIIVGIFLIGIGFIAQNFIDLMYYRKYVSMSKLPFFDFIFLKHGIITSIPVFFISVYFLLPPLIEYLTIGATPSYSWFQMLLGFTAFNIAVYLFGFGIIGIVLYLILDTINYNMWADLKSLDNE